MNNIIAAIFGGRREARTRALYQYDYGIILQLIGPALPVAYEVHFSASLTGEAAVVIGDEDGVAIPDEYLTTAGTLYAWVYLHTGDSDGETRYTVTIPVTARAKPSDYEPTPVEQSVITQAIAALNAGVKTVEDAVENIDQTVSDALQEAYDSGMFDGKAGPQGEKGDKGDPGPTGSDGVSPTVDVAEITGGHRVTITDATGAHSFDVADGEQGETGPKGDTGPQGEKGDKGDTGSQGPKGDTGPTGPQGPQGVQGEQGPQGEPGYTPVKGTDYWTDDDIAEIDAHAESVATSAAIAALSGKAFNREAKKALLDIFMHAAYADAEGQTYFSRLKTIFGVDPSITVTSISATLAEDVEVYAFDELDALREYLTVTATYSDGYSEPVNGYAMSGSFSSATNTITITYEDVTTTVSVSPTSFVAEAGAISQQLDINDVYFSRVTSAAARARITVPMRNRGYTFSVTDATKYNVAAYAIVDNTLETFISKTGSHPEYQGYLSDGTHTIAWRESDSVDTKYVWVALKKMDGTEFTSAEIEGVYGTVFTVTGGGNT